MRDTNNLGKTGRPRGGSDTTERRRQNGNLERTRNPTPRQPGPRPNPGNAGAGLGHCGGTDIAVTGKYGIAEIEELRSKQSKFLK